MVPIDRPTRPQGGFTAFRVLFALVMREMITRFGRSTGGYLWAVIEPGAFIALLSLAFSQIAHSPPIGRSFALFYATGYVAFSFYHEIAALTGRALQVNRPLLNYPSVTALDAILARFLLQVLTGLAVAAVIFTGILTAFADRVSLDLTALITVFALASLLGLGVGMVNASLFALSRTWERIYAVISRPLFLISGVFFTFGALPGFVRDVLWWNPLIHLVGIMRSAFYPPYDPGYVSVFYVLSVALALLTGGLLLLIGTAGSSASD